MFYFSLINIKYEFLESFMSYLKSFILLSPPFCNKLLLIIFEVKHLKQHLEIEFKNLLSMVEYESLLGAVFSDGNQKKIVQQNYYFDTKDHQLKNQQSALRIRKTDSFNELTLKVPSQGHLLETNLSLRDNVCSEILNAQQLKLSSINADIEIENISHESVFYLFNQFETVRFEQTMGDHLLVLDQTTFQNGTVDYELEIESSEAIKGKAFFDAFLEKHSVPTRIAEPKIARAAKRTQSFS